MIKGPQLFSTGSRTKEGSLSWWAMRTAIATASNGMEQRRNDLDSPATSRLVRHHFDGTLNCGEMDREGSVLIVCRHCASPLRGGGTSGVSRPRTLVS